MKRKIKVVDSPMGTGKTLAAIDYINQLDEDVNVLFVTPFLTECERIISGCPASQFQQPSEEGFGTKGRHFKYLLNKSANIVCTHALFTFIDDETLDILRRSNYILILDEVLDIITPYDIYKNLNINISEDQKADVIAQDTAALLKKEFITVDDNFLVHWTKEDDISLKCYENMKNLADRELLYYVNNAYLFWSFPTEVFEEDIFDDVFILTYLFEYQMQAYYYRFNGIPYEYYHVESINGKPKFIQTVDNEYERRWKEEVRPLIHICEKDKLNDIGRSYSTKNNQTLDTALSANWYRNNPEKYSTISKSLYNFLRAVPVKKRMFTTFKEFKGSVKSKYISSEAFVPLNARATNSYSNRTHCAYLVNRYMNPFLVHLFKSKGVELDQDKFALAEMVQWVWRSAIRNGHPIELYIPSLRMRTLFKQWLNNTEVHFEPYRSEYF